MNRIVCRILNRPVHHAISTGVHRVHHIRRVRRAIVLVCVVTGAGTGAAIVPPLVRMPSAPQQMAFFGPPDWFPAPLPYPGPETQPQPPGQPPQPVQAPEPGSLALLGTAVAAMIVGRACL